MKIAIGSDHGGLELKSILIQKIKDRGIEVIDVGCNTNESCDYPDYGHKVAQLVSKGETDQGVLICTSGIGMSITANRYPGIRAALCTMPEMACMAREHNDANILVLSAKFTAQAQAVAIMAKWLSSTFSKADRHQRRIDKANLFNQFSEIESIKDVDNATYNAIANEITREQSTVNLIASENYVSKAVREAQGCLMTNKYAEGFVKARYYNGCECVDDAEQLAISRAKEIFGAEHANVQVLSGSSANMAVYFSSLNPGDTILAMSLAHGGHLTHGHSVNFSGKFYKIIHYTVRRDNELVDYDEVQRLATENKPKMIVAGASAYSRVWDFERFRQIADSVGAMFMVDMAHIAGLVAAKLHPDPVQLADFVTTTTHKTLRGPRSGMVLCKAKYAKALDKLVFPGIQGGPHMHTIAAKAVCFQEAMSESYREYCRQIIKNANVMADALSKQGLRIVSGGTDNHLMLVDLTNINVSGKDAAIALEKAGITVNKNAIPYDVKPPAVSSGIRIGTPSVTTRGMKEAEMNKIAGMIVEVIKNIGNEDLIKDVRKRVESLTAQFPTP